MLVLLNMIDAVVYQPRTGVIVDIHAVFGH